MKQVFYSVPEIWDLALDQYYPKREFVEGFLEFLQKNGITKESAILDAGCGSGFPALDLAECGHQIVGTDKSSEMVRQIERNAEKRGLKIDAYNIKWSDLAERFGQRFDFIYCRGNSLVYASSWEQNWFVPERSREEIQKALQNFYDVLLPGGIAYVDITNRNEKPHESKIGIFNTPDGHVEMGWNFEHDVENHLRTWTSTLKFLGTGQTEKHISYSYLLPHHELIQMLNNVGFRSVDQYVPVKGEKNYDIFIGRK